MKREKLTREENQWIKDNVELFVSELKRKSELVKNFYQELEVFRINKDRIGYSIKFQELLKKEEEKLNGRKNQ